MTTFKCKEGRKQPVNHHDQLKNLKELGISKGKSAVDQHDRVKTLITTSASRCGSENKKLTWFQKGTTSKISSGHFDHLKTEMFLVKRQEFLMIQLIK